MLLKDLYKITSFKKEDAILNASIHLNKDHEIFKGHFPDNPVMPGVCMIQIIKELTEQALNAELFMEKSSNIKFMLLINPEVHADLSLELKITEEDNTIKVKNVTKFEDTLALKFSGTYRIDN